MFRAHIGAQFSILIIPHFALFCKCRAKADRVKFFWEKSSAGIEWPEFGASF